MVINTFNTGIYYHFGTNGTGEIGTKKSGTLYGYAMVCRLDNSVLFCVNSSAEFMELAGRHLLLFAQAPDFDTVSNSAGSAIIAGGKDSSILYDYRSHRPTVAGRPLGHQKGNIHEIRFPGRAFIRLGHGL